MQIFAVNYILCISSGFFQGRFREPKLVSSNQKSHWKQNKTKRRNDWALAILCVLWSIHFPVFSNFLCIEAKMHELWLALSPFYVLLIFIHKCPFLKFPWMFDEVCRWVVLVYDTILSIILDILPWIILNFHFLGIIQCIVILHQC